MTLRSLLILALLAPLALGTASAEAATITVTMDKETYSVVDTVAAATPPVATITIVDGEGAPAAGVPVSVSFLRRAPIAGFVSGEVVTGVTDENGVLTVTAPQNSCLPGTYFVAAFALETAGSTSYTVGA